MGLPPYGAYASRSDLNINHTGCNVVSYRNRMETVMASITLKNIPEALHQNLREQAARHHRSIHGEILAILEAYVRPPRRAQNRSWRRSGSFTLVCPTYGPPRKTLIATRKKGGSDRR